MPSRECQSTSCTTNCVTRKGACTYMQTWQISAAVEFVKLTHPHPRVPEYVTIYSRALHAVLGGACVRQVAEHALRMLGVWDTCQSFSRKASRWVLVRGGLISRVKSP